MRRRSAALVPPVSLLCLAAWLPLSPPLGAAEPPPAAGFGEAIDVSVAEVQVFVTDRGGKPVRGLAAGDFELRVDGRPTPITNFYAEEGAGGPAAGAPAASAPTARTAGAPAAVSSPGPPAGDRRLSLALFVDDLNLTPEARNQAITSLASFFRTGGLRPGDRVLLARFDGLGIKVRVPRA